MKTHILYANIREAILDMVFTLESAACTSPTVIHTLHELVLRVNLQYIFCSIV
jgi:hypothetical protein